MMNTKFLVKVKRMGARAPQYVQRIDRTSVETTTNRKLADRKSTRLTPVT